MWTFSCPIIAYGDYALEYIAQIQGKKAFIVTDKNIVNLGLVKLVTDQLDAVNIEWQVFDEIEPEPSLATIKKGGVAVGKYQPDWVIGLGGGSCIDAANNHVWIRNRRVHKDRRIFNHRADKTGTDAASMILLSAVTRVRS